MQQYLASIVVSFLHGNKYKVFLIDWLAMSTKYLNRSIGCGRFCQAISTLCEGKLGHVNNIKKQPSMGFAIGLTLDINP